MNIFYLSRDPVLCAEMHCDKHVVKMILETAQLLSTAHHMLGSNAPYKVTHKNHQVLYGLDPDAISIDGSMNSWKPSQTNIRLGMVRYT